MAYKTKEAKDAYHKGWRARNRAKWNGYSRRHYHGISSEEYQRMFVAQNGLCALCHCPETNPDRWTGKPLSLAVDHDHKTGKIRGLLCRKCNTALGLFKDSVPFLRDAIDYLEKPGRCILIQKEK